MRGPGEKVRRKLTQSVQFKLALAFFALITALLILLNTYPIAASRDIVFSEKESSLLEQAGVVAASLAGLDTLSGDGAGQVVELLGLSGFERVVVTDAAARIIYDTASPSAEGRYGPLRGDNPARWAGERVFFSAYSGDDFVSHAALPVTRDGAVVGAVYLCELDTEQAEIILALPRPHERDVAHRLRPRLRRHLHLHPPLHRAHKAPGRRGAHGARGRLPRTG